MQEYSLSKILTSCSLVLRRASSTSATTAVASATPNDSVSPYLYNRNPRNLERLRIATKLQGYALDNKPKNFWHRLVIQRTNRHISAHVEHFSGRLVVAASTKEWALKQHLRNCLDLPAATLVGRVLAQRCLQCGMLELHSDYVDETASSKTAAILEAMKLAGISLKEPERYLPHYHWSRVAMEKPWELVE